MLLFLIDGKLLCNANDHVRQSCAQLAHYFKFHYNCCWKIYNEGSFYLTNWHPLVPSPIPYPKIEVIDNLQNIDPSYTVILITTNDRIENLKIYSKVYPMFHFFVIDQSSDNIFLIKKQIETKYLDLLNYFRINHNPSKRFYNLLFPSDWEEVFYNRTTIPPAENPECDSFGPFGWYRHFEYSWALAQINYKYDKKTLDVGSLNTFIPRYLTEKGLDVVSIDIDPKAVDFQKKVASSLKKPFTVYLQDVRQTNFSNNTFDQILAISVIEHIPDEGDMIAMQELHRIVKVGGIVVVTVPYDHYWTHEDIGLRPHNYFQRYYSIQSVIERLVQPPTFEIVDLEFIGGERISPGVYKNQFINPTNAAVVCLALRKK